MLRAAGDPDSEVSVHSDNDLQQDNIIYRGKNGPRGRVCLVQKARGQQCVHRHNHFFLIYDVQGAWYFCHSRQCRKTDSTYVRFFLGELLPPVPAAQPVLALGETDKPQGRAGAAGPELASDIERELRQQLESPDMRFLKQKLLAGCEYSADYVQHVHKNLKQVDVKGQPKPARVRQTASDTKPVAPRQKPRRKGAQLVPRQESRRKRLKRVQEATDQSESESESPGRESKCAASDGAGQSKPQALTTYSSAGAPESETETDDATAEEESDAPATQAKKRDPFTRDLFTLLCNHCKEGSWTYELDKYCFRQQNCPVCLARNIAHYNEHHDELQLRDEILDHSTIEPWELMTLRWAEDKNERRDLTYLPTSRDFSSWKLTSNVISLSKSYKCCASKPRGRGLRVLCLGPRITFNLGLWRRLNDTLEALSLTFQFYQDIRASNDPNCVVYQPQSLHKLSNARRYDVLFIDEVNAVLESHVPL
eukprot:g37685.t1